MDEKQAKIVERIKKLLRLGRRTNHEGERDAALAKAAELAAAAGMEIGGIEPGETAQARITSEQVKFARRTFARVNVHFILKEHFGVFVVGGGGRLVYFGPAVNIAIARHVEVFLLREASQGWAEYRAANKLRKRGLAVRRKVWENGFFIAVTAALCRRPLRNDAEELRHAVERYAHSVMKLKTTKMQIPRGNARDFLDGQDAGRAVNLSRPVETGAQAPQVARTPLPGRRA